LKATATTANHKSKQFVWFS